MDLKFTPLLLLLLIDCQCVHFRRIFIKLQNFLKWLANFINRVTDFVVVLWW